MRILLVEDDELLGQGVATGLKQQNYSADWVCTGQAVLNHLTVEHYDVLILDIGLPDISGLQVLQALREKGQLLPVLILTALDSVDDRIAGLDAGADDYLSKPFDLEELYARIRALTRRAGGRAEPLLNYREIVLNPAAHTVTQSGSVVDVSRREYAVLLALLENTGRVLSRSRLEESLYSMDKEVGSNAVEVHIHHLRKKLGNELIKTVRGVGYTIEKLS